MQNYTCHKILRIIYSNFVGPFFVAIVTEVIKTHNFYDQCIASMLLIQFFSWNSN